MVGRIKNMIKNMKNPEQFRRLRMWQGRLDIALAAYDLERRHMDTKEAYYNGTREVQKNPNSKKSPTKLASNVRNIVYELIESQVDNSIPMPKVRPIHPEDIELAKSIEKALVNEISKIKYKDINDEQERVTPIQGGDFFHVQWDSTAGMHCTLGDVSVEEVHPKQVIPQPCVTELEKMDYVFLIFSQTKDFIKKRYGVNVEDAIEDRPDIRNQNDTTYNDDIVSQYIAYYRNKNGGIGMFSWVEDYILVDFEDYQERKLERCKKCGEIKTADVCPVCGGKKFEEVSEDTEEVFSDIPLSNGNFIRSVIGAEEIPVTDSEGNAVYDENGIPLVDMRPIHERIPYYKPNVFPLVIRKNISKSKKFLGGSDVDVIIDQQDTIKKLGTKINEKLLRGWSFATLPEGREITCSKNEMNIVRVRPQDVSLIGVYNMQPDISKDRVALEDNYDWARSSLGITDSYQGKYDSSATSGTAKQYSINQAAGRLESKRIMKNNAYAALYKMIFQFWLSYADQPIPLSYKKEDGTYEFSHFNRYDFLKKDDAGEWYWNDEFIFETDTTSSIMTNREAMWNAADVKYQAGAFGPIGDLESLVLYWKFMAKANYPNAGEILSDIQTRLQEQKEMQQALQEGDVQSEVSAMQFGNGDPVILV